MSELLRRTQALGRGEKSYSGLKCKRCGEGKRFTCNGCCCRCQAIRDKARPPAHRVRAKKKANTKILAAGDERLDINL